MNIIVIGYYNHNNAGDEQYKTTFIYLLNQIFNVNNKYIGSKQIPQYNLQFIDCDTLCNYKIYDDDIVILGGGDILNEYFIDKVINKFQNKPNKLIAVSVGLPYENIIINTNKLQVIDFIFVRTQQDIELFRKYFDARQIYYLPDISYYLLEEQKTCSQHIELYKNKSFEKIVKQLKTVNKKIICISLNRHIYKKKYAENYHEITSEFAKMVNELIFANYYIVFLPYNTVSYINPETNNENDIIIHNDVFIDAVLQYHINHHDNSKQLNMIENNILNIDCTMTPSEMFSLYDFFYITIPMRFHACLFSTYKTVPMIPVYTTKKIRNFLIDIDINKYGYELNKNEHDIPISMDANIILKKVNELSIHKNRQYVKKQMLSICNDTFKPILKQNIKTLTKLILKPYPKKKYNDIRELSPIEIIENMVNVLNAYSFKHEMVSDFRKVTKPHNQQQIVKMISYFLTKKIESPYNYGIQEKTFDEKYNYQDEWKWIINDNKENISSKIKNDPFGLYNITFIDQFDNSNAHRSGWQYVYNHIQKNHNEYSNLYLDLYLDRTFHWEKEIYKNLGIIPYKKSWVGFIHHTFDRTFSEYNNYTLLNDIDFIQSLQHCKGLFVLSEHLKTRFIEEITKMNSSKKANDVGKYIIIPPIHVLVHPTETNVSPVFSLNEFNNNNEKMIIHIGGWLRNIYSFYNFTFPKTIELHNHINYFTPNTYSSFIAEKDKQKQLQQIKKGALKGYSMNNYYPSNDFLEKMNKTLNEKSLPLLKIKNCSQNDTENDDDDNDIKNNWYKHFYEHIKSKINEVEIIEKVSNEEYDNILSKNIVFLNLIEPSAVNTIIECIIRNTPVIVNKHPAVVELLGEEYPLYYDVNDVDIHGKKRLKGERKNIFEMNIEIYNLITFDNIKKGYEYLKDLNKEKFHIEYFMAEFIKIIQTIQTIEN
jgi:hypothetical protein